jgi:hypothetical protein
MIIILLSLTFLLGCKGICTRYDKIGGCHQSAYQLGYKRCTECSLYIRFDGFLLRLSAKIKEKKLIIHILFAVQQSNNVLFHDSEINVKITMVIG